MILILGNVPRMPQRLTPSRRAVLTVLERARGQQLSAQELHRRARKLHPTIGLATVYRTLSTLSDEGAVDLVSTEHGEAAYRLCSPGHHHHLICSNCGTVVEIEDCDLGTLERALGRRYRFKITEHAVTFRGLCARCA